MHTEFTFLKVKGLLECVSERVPGHIDHLHDMWADEVLRDNV
jgi:hypothetical protein